MIHYLTEVPKTTHNNDVIIPHKAATRFQRNSEVTRIHYKLFFSNIGHCVCVCVFLPSLTHKHFKNAGNLLSSPCSLWLMASTVAPGRGELQTIIDQLVESLQSTSSGTHCWSLNDPAEQQRGKNWCAFILFTSYLHLVSSHLPDA